MKETLSHPATAFVGNGVLSAGPLIDVAMAVKNAGQTNAQESILVFDDHTGSVIDLDLRGSKADIIGRLTQRAAETGASPAADASPSDPELHPQTFLGQQRGRGRPKLGVVAREVTLLPRHWEWLAAQTGGASVTLRRLVEEAKRGDGGRRQRRSAQEAAYRFMSAMAGNLPGFEEASRALFADDPERFAFHAAQWPRDIVAYAKRLAFNPAPGDQ
ncbi:MAG TPA: DUF2239 family protein [Herbaspirillum sp.]